LTQAENPLQRGGMSSPRVKHHSIAIKVPRFLGIFFEGEGFEKFLFLSSCPLNTDSQYQKRLPISLTYNPK
jgi:hypothetical protein